MTTEELAELARLEAAATPGPWRVQPTFDTDDGLTHLRYIDSEVGFAPVDRLVATVITVDYGPRLETTADADAALIVAARNALPKLLRDIHDLDRFARRVLHVAESMDWEANTSWNGIADAIGSLPPDLYETLGGGKE